MREALGALYRELRVEAKGGTAPESVFEAKPAALGLREDGQARLRAEPRRMGLRVGDFTRHAPEDMLPSQKVARERDMTSQRVERARVLRGRYVDPAGYVSERELWGVARPAGLDAREAVALSQLVRVRRHLTVASEVSASPISPAGKCAVPGRSSRSARPGDSVARAVAAARALMVDGRFEGAARVTSRPPRGNRRVRATTVRAGDAQAVAVNCLRRYASKTRAPSRRRVWTRALAAGVTT